MVLAAMNIVSIWILVHQQVLVFGFIGAFLRYKLQVDYSWQFLLVRRAKHLLGLSVWVKPDINSIKTYIAVNLVATLVITISPWSLKK